MRENTASLDKYFWRIRLFSGLVLQAGAAIGDTGITKGKFYVSQLESNLILQHFILLTLEHVFCSGVSVQVVTAEWGHIPYTCAGVGGT